MIPATFHADFFKSRLVKLDAFCRFTIWSYCGCRHVPVWGVALPGEGADLDFGVDGSLGADMIVFEECATGTEVSVSLSAQSDLADCL